MYLPLQRAFVRCSGLYTPSDSHCLGFPNELKFKNGENGLDLTNPEMQDSMKRTKNWFMLAWWKTSNCYEDEPMMLDTFIWNSIVQRVSQLRNIQVQCCPYLGGGVRISFFCVAYNWFLFDGQGHIHIKHQNRLNTPWWISKSNGMYEKERKSIKLSYPIPGSPIA